MVPKPKYFHPVNGLLDRYGYFGVLYTPTINRFWTFTTQSLMIDVEGDDPQTQAGKSAAKTMDSLYKPAVPGRFADEEMEVFLSSNPFADWRSQVHRQPDDRFIPLDSDIFPTTPYF